MVLEAVIMIGTAVMLMVVLLAVGSYIIAILTPVAPDLFLSVPKIGEVSCDPPAVTNPTPAFIFGKPGYASAGCVHLYMIQASMAIVGFVFGIGIFTVYTKGALNGGSEVVMQMVKYMGSSIIILILIPTFHYIYDGIAGLITSSSMAIAAIPQGPANDYAQMKQFAGIDIMTPFDKMRDPVVAKHECINPVDVDHDGQVDRYDLNFLCFISTSFLSPEFFQTLMIFTIGNMIGIMTTLIVFVAVVIKYLLTGVLAVAFPLLLALSRLPKIGDIFEDWTKAFYGLLAAPILLAIVAAVAPVVILGELTQLHEQGGASADAEKYVAFIMFVAMAYTYMAIVIGCAKVLGSVMMSASTVVMGAAMAGFGAVMGTARAGGTAAVGATMGRGAAEAFNAGFGFMPGAGGQGSVMNFARNSKDLEAGAPANDMISSATGTSNAGAPMGGGSSGGGSGSSSENSWSGGTEVDMSDEEDGRTLAPNATTPKNVQNTVQKYGVGATMGSAAVMPWGVATEQAAMAVHPSAKHAASIRKDGDRLKLHHLWPISGANNVADNNVENETAGELPDNSASDTTTTTSDSTQNP